MAWATLLGVALYGCGTPERVRTEQVVVRPPPAWHADAAPGAVDAEWWCKLGGAGLRRAIEAALLHNPDVLSARARLTAAIAQARVAGAAAMPQLDLGGTASRQRSVFVGFPFGGSGPLSNTFSSFGVDLNASWEADLWGRIAAAEDSAAAAAIASVADLRALRQSLAGQTAKAWFATVEARLQVQLAARTQASYDDSERQIERRFQQGVRAALDLRLARSRRLAALAQLHAWEERYARAVRQLEVLQGRYPTGTSTLPETLPDPAEAVPAGLPAELIGRRPDLIAAQARVAAAGFRVKEASASMYPRLSLMGQVGTTSNRPSDLTDLDFLIWTLAANLVAPLIDGGRLRAGLDLAVARETEVIADFAQTALQAFREVESLLAVEQHLRQRIGNLATATGEATAARQLSESRYRQGLGDYLAVLEAQRSALDLEGQWLDARRALLDLRVDLHLALGGGFPPEIESPDGHRMPASEDKP